MDNLSDDDLSTKCYGRMDTTAIPDCSVDDSWLDALASAMVRLKSLLSGKYPDDALTSIPDIQDGFTWVSPEEVRITSIPDMPDGFTWVSSEEVRITSIPDDIEAKFAAISIKQNRDT